MKVFWVALSEVARSFDQIAADARNGNIFVFKRDGNVLACAFLKKYAHLNNTKIFPLRIYYMSRILKPVANWLKMLL